jgi:hypothetical protein
VSIRKIAGLTAGFALAVGLIGNGVSAQWAKSVTAQENITVGSFGCAITSDYGTTSGDTVTYQVPPITQSVPGAAPFTFTVTNTGTVPTVLTESASAETAPFSDMLGTQQSVILNGNGDSHTYQAGLSWTDLTAYTGGLSASVTYTVNCTEKPAINVVVTGPVVGDAGSPLAGQNVLKLTTQGVGFANGLDIILHYDATPGITGEVYDNPETIFGSQAKPNTSSFSNVYFEENCSVNGSGNPSVGVGVSFTITATQGSNVASFTGTLPCSLVHNP